MMLHTLNIPLLVRIFKSKAQLGLAYERGGFVGVEQANHSSKQQGMASKHDFSSLWNAQKEAQ